MTPPATHVGASLRGPSPTLRPTLVFAGGFALAVLLHRAVPMRIAIEDGPGLPVVGAIAVAAGVLLFLWALLVFFKARTGIMFEQPATRLIRKGPYAWSRNPQYVAFAAVYVGAAVLMNTLWPLAVLPVVLVSVFIGVIAAEERYLRSIFGTEFDAYCRQVRRWV